MGLAGLIMGWIGTVLVTLAWLGYFAFLGFLVSTPEFQDGFEQEFEQEFEQQLEQEMDDQGLDQLDPELQDAIDEQLQDG